MNKEVVVISLGGSQILNNGEVNVPYLNKFKKIIIKHKKRYNFVVVCGGGSVARTYINGLRKIGASEKLQGFAGISVTRTNARFVSYFFGTDQLDGIPHDMAELKRILKSKGLVFTGALRYKPEQTSDSTAAEIARELGGELINITNVDGLYDKNPKEYKNAKFIPEISWNDFNNIVKKMKFAPGQHFVLDQGASRIIKKEGIKTVILGDNLDNLDKLLSGKSFRGTIISG